MDGRIGESCIVSCLAVDSVIRHQERANVLIIIRTLEITALQLCVQVS